MPKPIAMTIEVEEIAFGKIWRTLDAMNGVVAIHLKGNGPKQQKTAKPNGGKKTVGTNIPNLILLALAMKGELNRVQLGDLLEANGKAKSSLPDAVSKLKKAKQIRVVGKGTYKITTAGHKAIPQQE